jgi:hypothetical protein
MSTIIAKNLGLIENGFQEGTGKWFFTDPVTGTSFLAGTVEEACRKLYEKRELFLKF